MNDELPEGWAKAKLADLLEPRGLFDGPFGSRLKTSDYTNHGVRVIRLENVANLRFIGDKHTYISNAKYLTLKKHTVGAGDVIVGSFVDGAVRVCVVPALSTKAIAKADCFCVRTRPELERRFLAYQLGANGSRDALIEEIHGATRPRITTRQLRQFEIAVAPPAEQHRIVEKIEALLAHVNAARVRLATVPAILTRSRQSILAAACSGALTENWRNRNAPASLDILTSEPPEVEGWAATLPDSWKWVSGESIYADARYGTSVKCDRNDQGGIAVLRVPNIASGALDVSDLKYAPFASENEWSRLFVQPGDVLVCRTNGSLDLVGKAAVVPKLTGRHAFASYLIRLRLDESSIDPKYFHAVLSSPLGRSQLADAARTTAGQFNLNLEILGDLRIPLPSLSEQREIVRRIEALFSISEVIECRVTAATARADKLTQAILAKAFMGDLVPTEAELACQEGREYEPASVLLERMRSERAASLDDAPNAKRKRRAANPLKVSATPKASRRASG